MDLLTIFNSLPNPQITGKDFVFCASPIDGYENHRISKDERGNATLLIASVKNSQEDVLPNIKFRNLSVLFDARCKITQENYVEEGYFTVLTFLGDKIELQTHFLKLCSLLLSSLGNSPKPSDIYKEVYRFVDLFKSLSEPPLKTVQGLWAELFLIEQSKQPMVLINAWHVSPNDRLDFNFGIERIEVKSSSTRHRVHHFSQEQLTSPANTKLIIASIFTEPTNRGVTLEELAQKIQNKVSNQINEIYHLNAVIMKTLGNSLDEAIKLAFDYELAQDSLQYYQLEDIPKIAPEHIPPQIFDLKFRVDLSGVPSKRKIKSCDKQGLFNSL
ncbi:MAG: hypothetical protein BWK78_01900 [Thiotrichaceae bacterium IS1]|nr:MAG: hypothetical protein BWK78_01900 [Thiotrichaceae bacterium IS1]